MVPLIFPARLFLFVPLTNDGARLENNTAGGAQRSGKAGSTTQH